ncbi:MAG TPA: hypothetical protein VGN24_03440 [Rhodanobacter sp.]|jgi:transcriptional regulator with XRE-family HTH domain|nr:hypothetical protein [Rhodanobacter sp.]
MSATIKLLDNYKKVCSLATDSAAADALGVTRGAVHLWKKGSSHPDAVSIEKMCNATREPLRTWLPLIEAERAHSPQAKRVWLRLAGTVTSLAAFAAVIHYSADAHSASAFLLTPVYIMRIYRWCEGASN